MRRTLVSFSGPPVEVIGGPAESSRLRSRERSPRSDPDPSNARSFATILSATQEETSMQTHGIASEDKPNGSGGAFFAALSADFRASLQKKDFKPVLTSDDLDANNKFPEHLLKEHKIGERTAQKFYDQLPIIEDGSLALYKQPFGKNNYFYVVSAQSGDGSVENDYFSKFDMHSGHEQYGVG
jgi:hypothetical protein